MRVLLKNDTLAAKFNTKSSMSRARIFEGEVIPDFKNRVRSNDGGIKSTRRMRSTICTKWMKTLDQRDFVQITKMAFRC